DSRRAAAGTLGETLFFSGCDTAIGCELWKSDGTAQGTSLVLDITPNPPSASSWPGSLVDVGGTLDFTACAPTTGCDIWRSDGTEEGTTLVADLESGSADESGPTSGTL